MERSAKPSESERETPSRSRVVRFISVVRFTKWLSMWSSSERGFPTFVPCSRDWKSFAWIKAEDAKMAFQCLPASPPRNPSCLWAIATKNNTKIYASELQHFILSSS